MKLIVSSILFFIFISSFAYAELTKQDLEEIRKIVKESEDRLRTELKGDIADVKDDISYVRWTVIALFGVLGAIIAAALGLPQIRERKTDKEEREVIEELKELRDRISKIEAKQEVIMQH